MCGLEVSADASDESDTRVSNPDSETMKAANAEVREHADG
jgi:hypothetical protein